MRLLLFISTLLFLVTSCIQEDKGCVNVSDCPEGYICELGDCVLSETWDSSGSKNDDSITDNSIVNDNAVVSDDSADNVTVNDDLPNNDEDTAPDVDEQPDEQPDDGPECEAGWHMEDEGDDENASGDRDCAKNVICNNNPCNQNGKCTETEWSATCECYEGYDGRWCEICASGYLLSTVDDKCKADCATGDHGCTGTKECGVDPGTNEAGCVCKENYSGTDCTICDSAVFCNSHGACYASTGSPVCTCEAAWNGDATCSTCAEGYLLESGNCIEGCTDYCGYSMGIVSAGLVLADSNGSCEIVSGEAKCVCDSGWKSTITYNIGGQIKPPCSDCDTDNPPAGGCPE